MTDGVAVTEPFGIAVSVFEVMLYLPSAEALVVVSVEVAVYLPLAEDLVVMYVPLGSVIFTVLLGVASPVTVRLPSLLVVIFVMVTVGAFS